METADAGYNEAIDGLRTEVRTVVRRNVNTLTLTEAIDRLRSNMQSEMSQLNPDFESRCNLHVLKVAVEPKYTEDVLTEMGEIYGSVQLAVARRRIAATIAEADTILLNSLKQAGLNGRALADAYRTAKAAVAQVEAAQNLSEGKAPLIIQVPTNTQ